jgi:Uma2 family endonuclease
MIATARFHTFADVLDRLGVPAQRVRFTAQKLGRATVRDLIAVNGKKQTPCELVDGFLVEKPMGAEESFLAATIIGYLHVFLTDHDLGFVLAPDGPFRLAKRLVLMPDVSFVSWKQRPEHTIPDDPVPELYPDLAVEVISPSNTRKEIARKLTEYFKAGTTLAWVVYPKKRTVVVYTSPDQGRELTVGDRLDGGTVLPGFKLELKKLFAKLDKKQK